MIQCSRQHHLLEGRMSWRTQASVRRVDRQLECALGLAAGLAAVDQRMRTSTGPTTSTTRPLDPRPLLSFVLVVGLLIWGGVVAVRARRPLYAGYVGAGTGTMPPDELPPALVGALIHGQASDREVRATILQM